MEVTVDGAGLYITLAHYGQGTLIRGNLIHDTQWNTFGRGEVPSGIHDTIPCHGLYLDGNNTGCRYENNVVFRNAGGPLLFGSKKEYNTWIDNLFQKNGTPPQEFIAAMQAWAGLEPAYRQSILKKAPNPCNFQPLTDPIAANAWVAYLFDLPQDGRGVIEMVQRVQSNEDFVRLKLPGLDASGLYALKGYAGTLAKADQYFYEGTFFGNCDKNLFTKCLAALGDLPILSNVQTIALESKLRMSGRELIEQGLPIKVGGAPRVVWISYQKVDTSPPVLNKSHETPEDLKQNCSAAAPAVAANGVDRGHQVGGAGANIF